MKRIILLLTFSFTQALLFSQWLEYKNIPPIYNNKGVMIRPPSIDTLIHLNRIFVVDGTIPDSEFGVIGGNTIFILEYDDSKRDTIDFYVRPGDIKMYLSDYEYIMKQENIETIYMQFEYWGLCYNKKGKSEFYDYEIPLKNRVIFSEHAYYMIIYIYNTDKKENKKHYVSLPGKTYNYQLIYPQGEVRIGVQKKWTKKQKDCWKYTDYHRKKSKSTSGISK